MNNKNKESIVIQVSTITLLSNLLLSVFKMFAGLIGHSSAMISDAVHSASDVMSTIVVVIGIKFSQKKADACHPYGHERLECVAALILSIMLGLTGLGIAASAVQSMLHPESLLIPTTITIVAAIVSIIVKELMYWYTRNAAKIVHSGAMLADAWHHRSDALSSIGGLIGIIGARMGLPILDPIAGLIISLIILKVSYDIFKDAIDKMVDKSCDQSIIEKITTIINHHDDVVSIDDIKTRLFGDKIYIDIEISASSLISLVESHQIAHDVHDDIEKTMPEVKHCMIHVNPYFQSTN